MSIGKHRKGGKVYLSYGSCRFCGEPRRRFGDRIQPACDPVRFFADWDDDDTNLIGEYSITLAQLLVASFRVEVLSKLKCSTAREGALAYFQRIEA